MKNSKSPLKIKKITIWLLIASLLIISYLGVKGFFPAFHRVADLENGWNLILVNQEIYIPDDYDIELTVLSNGERVDSRIYPDLQDMFDNARKDGVYPVVGAGFRTHEKQQTLFDQKIEAYLAEGYSKTESRKLAKEAVALPDTSEHQLGIAVDINADKSKSTNNEVYNWLAQNAYHYGFILRYPPDKTDITGTAYEPWHYRYVGKDAAREMYNQKVCLEEYIDGLD